MRTFGPLALTVNTRVPVALPSNTTAVYIGNDSIYDMLVALSDTVPAVVTQAGDPWNAIVQAGHHLTLTVPTNIYTPQGSTGYTGSLYLLPLGRTGQASTGLISSTAQAWVIACQAGETPPDAYAMPRSTDLSSQPRVVTIPVQSSNSFHDGFGWTGGNHFYEPFPPNIGLGPVASTWNGTTPAYISVFSLTIGHTGAALADFKVQVTAQKFDLTVLATYEIMVFYLPNPGVLVYTPAFPFVVKVTPPNGANTLNVRYATVNGDGVGQSGFWQVNCAIDVDTANPTSVPAMGGGYLYNKQVVWSQGTNSQF